MKGGEALARALVDAGVDLCLMNPGTSEMHFVAALDDVPAMRGVLALFEGVATGAADGYGRMADRPAAVLLHLGPGLGNGLANLHNARRARTPVVNVVGDHATSHKVHDAPLESDIETVARNVSTHVARVAGAGELAAAATAAVVAAHGPPGQVATLVVPADATWDDVPDDHPGPRDAASRSRSATGAGARGSGAGAGGGGRGGGADPAGTAAGGAAGVGPQGSAAPGTQGSWPGAVGPGGWHRPPLDGPEAVAAALRAGEPAALLVGGRACRAGALHTAGRIAASTGARLLCETFPARLERGAGRVPVERLAYLAELAALQLDGLRHLVLVDARPPVSFFAYPGRASDLVPDGCRVHHLASAAHTAGEVQALLDALAEQVGDAAPVLQDPGRPDPPSGPLTAQSVAQALGALLPEDAVVSDEGNTSGLFIPGATAGAPPHDWLCLTGGAIGQGLPVALGAALAEPRRRVVAIESEGSALYTPQAWWTMAREGLDVTTVLLNNRAYSILGMELGRVGAHGSGARARRMLELDDPDLEPTALARGMGVPAVRVSTADELVVELARSFATPGPTVVEAVIPPVV
ncbi:MAG: acetolactate synthase large subunit [Acidimicrobiia bacterium]